MMIITDHLDILFGIKYIINDFILILIIINIKVYSIILIIYYPIPINITNYNVF
jgi:hypothetical protein